VFSHHRKDSLKLPQMEKKFLCLKSYFQKCQKVLILLHLEPDGDTISSALALFTYLKRQGKHCDCAVNGEVPEIFHFLPGSNEIKKDFLLGDYDLIIAVDCGDAKRTGFPTRLEQICHKRPLINIDHHFKNNLHKIASVNIINEKASATCEIVFDLLNYLEAKIDKRIATYILAGIYYDTGGFQHSNVTGKTLKIASECLRLGARINLISQHINGSKSSGALRLWGIALKKMKIKKNGIVYSTISQADLAIARANAEDASGIVNLINTVPKSRLAILFLENPDGTMRASLRTETEGVDVSRLARIFGGGGHKKAAGFTVGRQV